MFRHIPITDDTIWLPTLERWKAEALALGDEGVFVAFDVEERFCRLKRQTENEKDLHCYFLVKNGNNFASSILEVSHALPKSNKPWLKLLDISLQPSLLPVEGKEYTALKEAFLVSAYSISHAIGLIFNELPSKELKVYGRTPEMKNLFTAIVSTTELDQALDLFQLSIRLEGSWLILERNEA
jgi:hypothetical protein